jgi:heme exporter protein C
MRRALPTLAVGLIATSLVLAVAAPPERVQGDFAKMLFLHVPAVMAAYTGFATALIAAVVYLIGRRPGADRVSASAVEVGVLFTGLTLVTGMIWGRPTWGVWWDWGDARMMSTALMFFFYLGYLALRRAIIDPDLRARRSAFFAILAFVQVPIVHFSVHWFRTLHQSSTIIRPDVENAPIDPVYSRALGISILAFLILFLWFLDLRTRIASTDDVLEAPVADREMAGSAVTSPDLGGARG